MNADSPAPRFSNAALYVVAALSLLAAAIHLWVAPEHFEEAGLLDLACTLAEVGVVAILGVLAMKGLPTQGRIQIVVILVVSALFFWHLLHLLAGSSLH